MPFFSLTSNITIGSFQFQGVHEVRTHRSIHSIEDRATISVPSIAKIIKNGQKSSTTVTTGTLFQDGDAVHINLGYNGDVNSEFVGFVRRRGTGLPLVVECEGYSWQLRNVNVTKNFSKKNTSAKALLQLATQGTDITVQCPVDFTLAGINLVNANGLQIVNFIKEASDHTLSIFFIEPKVLWCGLTYTAYATDSAPNTWGFPTVNYRLGWNCLRDNGLKERIPSQPVQIKYAGKYANGNAVETASKEKAAKNKLKSLLSHVPDATTLSAFAQEKAYRANYVGYEGKLTGFLLPNAYIGFDAYIVNKEYPELTGKYLIEEVDVHFGMNGARRVLTIGPFLGFTNNKGYKDLMQ